MAERCAIWLYFVMLIVVSSAHAETIRLRPPFTGTYRQTAYMDHARPFATDGFILIYDGERMPDSSPYPYDGHEGNDWGMGTGTSVLAAAQGQAVQAGWQNPNDHSQGYGLRVRVDHQNGYETLYGHLNNLIVNQGDPVVEGELIALSGNTGNSTGAHLHLSVYNNGNLTDPFGWRGSGQDPLYNYNAEVSTCLWRSLDADSISCADTIAEDAGRGSTVSGSWNETTVGNGYHAYYRSNLSAHFAVYVTWNATNTVAGTNKVYAFIPSQTATTHSATYYVHAVSGWVSHTIDQGIYNDEWVSLGVYTLPLGHGHVILYANTGEITGTRLVAADAIKFRSYTSFLPVVLNDLTSP